MPTVNLSKAVNKLNETCREMLESAAGLALSRTHYDVELEHWLLKLVGRPASDVAVILDHFDIDLGRLSQDINRQIDQFRTGNGRTPALAPGIVSLIRDAWLIASLEEDAREIRSGYLLLALLADNRLAPAMCGMSGQLARVPVETLRTTMAQITAGSDEAKITRSASSDDVSPRDTRGASGALDQYTVDLTQRARDGGIDPVFGREPEVRQIVDILTRRRQNNPILTGDAGVGKTAVVEGLALRIVQGDVPDMLKPVRLLSLDLGLLQAGAGIKGEFENRLRSVIDEVKNSAVPVIMFIDEAHTLIGAGGAEGQNDAANLLKPALARGEMRTVAATTWAEYKKYFEKDPALTRRFQTVKVEEPSESLTVAMLRGLVPVLERHHGVRILGDALNAAAALSHRYLPERQLPDKAISLLDTACARVGISQAATPPALEDLDRQLRLRTSEMVMLDREGRESGDMRPVHAEWDAQKAQLEAERATMAARWQEELAAVDLLTDRRKMLDVAAGTTDFEDRRVALQNAQAHLAALQGETPIVHAVVDRNVVAEVLAGWTGIPVRNMISHEIEALLTAKERLASRIKGQPHALDTICQAIQTARVGLADPRKPLGVFLFCGTSGVGKTETALAMAELLYGGEQSITTINMSEFKEEHKISMLVGAAPGYVGYGEGGILTEAIRRKPHSILLIDEMEKAHPGVQDVFYQIFDKGQLRDGQGRNVDFRNTIIIMTSNAGSETISMLSQEDAPLPTIDDLANALQPELQKYFKYAFLGRVTIVPYLPLSSGVLRQIVNINLERIRDRVAKAHGARLSWNPVLLDMLVARCTVPASGARQIEKVIKHEIVFKLTEAILAWHSKNRPLKNIRILLDNKLGCVIEAL